MHQNGRVTVKERVIVPKLNAASNCEIHSVFLAIFEALGNARPRY
jgi:hypothetical protein